MFQIPCYNIPMHQIYRTEGIILKQTLVGEADIFVTILTKDFGKITLLAKGAKKISAKLAPHLDILNRSEIAFIKGKNFWRITNSATLNYHRNIKLDFNRLMAGFFIIELASQLVEENAIVKQEYKEVVDAIRKLEIAKNNKFQYVPYIFTARFFSLLGYHPELKAKNNEIKLLRICLERGHNALDNIDLSSINMNRLKIIIEKMLREVVHKDLNTWENIV